MDNILLDSCDKQQTNTSIEKKKFHIWPFITTALKELDDAQGCSIKDILGFITNRFNITVNNRDLEKKIAKSLLRGVGSQRVNMIEDRFKLNKEKGYIYVTQCKQCNKYKLAIRRDCRMRRKASSRDHREIKGAQKIEEIATA